MITNKRKQQLITAAKKALHNPYAKDYTVIFAAAVLTSQGNIYTATQYFSDTYSLTLHAEQAALCHAACHGEGEILAIAVASTESKAHDEFTNPCHMCKQLLYETQRRTGVPLVVLLTNDHNEIMELKFEDMISYPWPT